MSPQVVATPYRPEMAEQWDRFVDASRNGTLFHMRRFLGYHPPDRFADASLVLHDGKRLVSVFPAAWTRDPDFGTVLNSHPGASYGGPVFAANARTATVHAVIEAIRRYACAEGADAIQMRLAPHVFHRPAMEELEFVLKFQGFAVCRTELSSYVDLAAIQGDLLQSFSPACRNKVRMAMRAALVSGESDDFAQFWEILADNLQRRYGVAPTHSREELRSLKERFPDRIRLFAVHDATAMLAGTVLFVCNDESAHTFYMASRQEAQKYRPLNLAVYAALVWAKQRGLARVNFGVSTPDGRSINWGLLSFKESFGARGVFRDTYRMVLNRRGDPGDPLGV